MTTLARRLPWAVVLVALFLIGVIVGRQNASTGSALTVIGEDASDAGRDFPSPLNAERMREVWNILHEKFAGSLDDTDLAVGALRGIVAGTGDPYTSYADPEESRQFDAELSGSFSGIGVEIGLRRGSVMVIAPLRGSPAERAGLRARDVIAKIDGEEVTHKLTLTEIVSRIRGPEGTEVRISVAREGEEALLEIAVRRERILIESVKLEMRDGIAIITVTTFNGDTDQRFRRAVRELLAAKARGVILDLRNNPGGILQQAVDVAGHFLPRQTLVVTEVPRSEQERVEHRTSGPSDLGTMPVVVAMNGGSASAAEILAGALQEQRAIPLVGERTFGKGSVQELVDLSDGSTLRVTIARWHTPRDTEIGEDGIAPTVEVQDERPTEEPDEILEKALELLRQEIGTPQ